LSAKLSPKISDFLLTWCLSVLDFWNVNLGVYYKLEKKSISKQTRFFVEFELDFYCLCSLQKSISKSNWFFNSLNLIFRNWKKIKWHLIFQKSSGDRHGDWFDIFTSFQWFLSQEHFLFSVGRSYYSPAQKNICPRLIVWWNILINLVIFQLLNCELRQQVLSQTLTMKVHIITAYDIYFFPSYACITLQCKDCLSKYFSIYFGNWMPKIQILRFIIEVGLYFVAFYYYMIIHLLLYDRTTEWFRCPRLIYVDC